MASWRWCFVNGWCLEVEVVRKWFVNGLNVFANGVWMFFVMFYFFGG